MNIEIEKSIRICGSNSTLEGEWVSVLRKPVRRSESDHGDVDLNLRMVFHNLFLSVWCYPTTHSNTAGSKWFGISPRFEFLLPETFGVLHSILTGSESIHLKEECIRKTFFFWKIIPSVCLPHWSASRGLHFHWRGRWRRANDGLRPKEKYMDIISEAINV